MTLQPAYRPRCPPAPSPPPRPYPAARRGRETRRRRGTRPIPPPRSPDPYAPRLRSPAAARRPHEHRAPRPPQPCHPWNRCPPPEPATPAAADAAQPGGPALRPDTAEQPRHHAHPGSSPSRPYRQSFTERGRKSAQYYRPPGWPRRIHSAARSARRTAGEPRRNQPGHRCDRVSAGAAAPGPGSGPRSTGTRRSISDYQVVPRVTFADSSSTRCLAETAARERGLRIHTELTTQLRQMIHSGRGSPFGDRPHACSPPGRML